MIVGDLMWLVGVLVAVIYFTLVEGFALKHPERANTLSYCIAYIGNRLPLSIWICGVFVGGLTVHFFWHYCPQFGG